VRTAGASTRKRRPRGATAEAVAWAMAGESIGVTKRYPRRGSVSMKRGLSADSPRAPLKRATALCTLWSKSTNVSAGQSCARNSWCVTTKVPTSRWRPYGGGGSRSESSQRPAPLRTVDRQRSKQPGQFPPGCAYRGFSVVRRPGQSDSVVSDPLMKYLFGDHHVDALVAVNELGDVEVGRDAC